VILRVHYVYKSNIGPDVTIIIKPPRCPLEWLSGPLHAVTGYLSRSGVVVRVSVLTGSIDRVRFIRTGAGTCIITTGNTAAMRFDRPSAAVLTLDISQRHLPSPRHPLIRIFSIIWGDKRAVYRYTPDLLGCAHREANLLRR